MLLERVRVSIGECSLSMLDFMDWLGSKKGMIAVFFLFSHAFFGLLASLYTSRILSNFCGHY